MTQKKDIEQLFRTHYAAMYRMAILILHEEESAKDIVHDVFETLFASGSTDVSRAYLLKAVRNRCLNFIRSLSVRERMKELYFIDGQEVDGEEWPDDDTITQIRSTVANDLSAACRRVVNLRFVEGKSYKEIAGFLGISEVAVYKHLRHAIDVVRSKLSRNG